MSEFRNVPEWTDNQHMACGFTTRGFGSLSARCDTQETVDQRFNALARQFTLEPTYLFTLPQTHSNNVAILRNRAFLDRREGGRGYRAVDSEVSRGGIYIEPTDFDLAWQKGVDGVILAIPNVIPVVLTADCAPVLFWAPERTICGIAHVGLVGAINQLSVRMVTLMQQEFGVRPESLEVVILPSIRSCHYNLSKSGVWQRLRHATMERYGDNNPHYQTGFFDLPGFIRSQLETAGVRPAQIFDLGVCTVCEAHNFFSHVHAGLAGAQDREGRFGSLMGLRSTAQ